MTRPKPGSRERAFQFEQPAFGFKSGPAAIAAQAAVAGDHSVAWDNDWHGIARQSLPDRTTGFWSTHFLSDAMICPHATRRDPTGDVQHVALKRSKDR